MQRVWKLQSRSGTIRRSVIFRSVMPSPRSGRLASVEPDSRGRSTSTTVLDPLHAATNVVVHRVKAMVGLLNVTMDLNPRFAEHQGASVAALGLALAHVAAVRGRPAVAMTMPGATEDATVGRVQSSFFGRPFGNQTTALVSRWSRTRRWQGWPAGRNMRQSVERAEGGS